MDILYNVPLFQDPMVASCLTVQLLSDDVSLSPLDTSLLVTGELLEDFLELLHTDGLEDAVVHS